MEASFFSEEKCSTFYNQAADLDIPDASIFDRLVSNNGKQFDSLTTFWDQIDDDPGIFGGGNGAGEHNARGNRKEDFNKMLNEWQEHLSSMQVLDNDKIRPEIPDMFSVLPTSQPAVSIDELFPVECSISVKEELILENEHSETKKSLDDVQEEMQTDSDTEECGSDNNSIEKFMKDETKKEHEDECVDVETVGEKMPVLEAGDMTTLLEQFEASEAVNTSCKEVDPQNNMSHQNIRDALPKEVIDRIKASTRKKSISLIPPMPTKKTVRTATRMQDAAALLSRNKLLKLVSNNGESVQLDHDYCSGTGSEGVILPPNNFYQTDVADYGSSIYSRLPDYYITLAPKKALDPSKAIIKDWGEKNSKKDSGLESGDVSDASEEVPALTKTMSMVSVLKRNNLPQNSVSSTAKTNNSIVTAQSSSSCCSTSTETSSPTPDINVEPVRKKKLNLEEYRSRREERERIRCEEDRRTSFEDLSFDSRSSNTSSSSSVVKEDLQIQEQQPKVVMHSVEVQASPEDIENHDASKSKIKHGKNNQEPSRRRREYRTRRVSSSSSSSSPASRHSKHRSSKRIRRNSNSNSRNGSGPPSRTRSIWSRSRSRSSSSSSLSSCSTCASRSRSRSRSPPPSDSRRNGGGKWGTRPLWRTKHRFNKSFSRRDSWRHQRASSWVSGSGSRSCSSRDSSSQNPPIEWSEKEKIRQVEERRVIYVGRIEEGTTKAHLRERFSVFGPIIDISVHFREHGDNYGFVTFAYKVDAYEALEHGNDDPLLPHYDLSFGGRRAFCKQRYADLDGERNNSAYRSSAPMRRSDASFDCLLREAQAKLNKRSSV